MALLAAAVELARTGWAFVGHKLAELAAVAVPADSLVVVRPAVVVPLADY